MSKKAAPLKKHEKTESEIMINTGIIMLLFSFLSIYLFPTNNIILSLLISLSSLIIGLILCLLGLTNNKSLPKVKTKRNK